MPLYEYKCTECAKEFEVRQKFSDEPVKECIECSGRVEKMISKSNFSLKGGGWFKDGYSSSSNQASTSAPSSTPAPSSDACAGCPSAQTKSD